VTGLLASFLLGMVGGHLAAVLDRRRHKRRVAKARVIGDYDVPQLQAPPEEEEADGIISALMKSREVTKMIPVSAPLDEKKQWVKEAVREIIDVVELSEYNTRIKIRFTLRCEGGADSDRIVEIRKEFNSYFYYPSGHDVAGKTLDFLREEMGPYHRRKRWEAEAKEQPA